jgi:hypothetical protein
LRKAQTAWRRAGSVALSLQRWVALAAAYAAVLPRGAASSVDIDDAGATPDPDRPTKATGRSIDSGLDRQHCHDSMESAPTTPAGPNRLEGVPS